MSNDLATAGRRHRALPSLVLAVIAVAFLLVSVARAEDPPIVSAGPISSGGNTASGSVGSGGQVGTCVNDQSSGADPSNQDPNTAAIVLIGLPEILRSVNEYRIVAFGALLVTMMIWRPEGLLPSLRRKRELHQAEVENIPNPRKQPL